MGHYGDRRRRWSRLGWMLVAASAFIIAASHAWPLIRELLGGQGAGELEGPSSEDAPFSQFWYSPLWSSYSRLAGLALLLLGVSLFGYAANQQKRWIGAAIALPVALGIWIAVMWSLGRIISYVEFNHLLVWGWWVHFSGFSPDGLFAYGVVLTIGALAAAYLSKRLLWFILNLRLAR